MCPHSPTGMGAMPLPPNYLPTLAKYPVRIPGSGASSCFSFEMDRKLARWAPPFCVDLFMFLVTDC